jgi:2-polyprenyl-6-methoxyphenol hydroxylase-like FAD-dependent oxidoreductase
MPRAIVIGGSLGGLFAANLLARAGWDVEVFERVGTALAGRGAGIITHAGLFRALERSGVAIDATLGVEVARRVTLDRAGNVAGSLDVRQVLTAWGRLYRLLKDAFPDDRYHFSKALARVEQDAQGVTAHFTDGTHAQAELLVAADGIRSTVRAQLAPQEKPVYAGYIAWRGLAHERELSAATHTALFERFGFCLPPDEQMLGYPVAGPGNSVIPGERHYNFVWYRPADERAELPALLTDTTGRRHEMSTPPDRVRPEVVADMRAAAEAVLAPQFAEIVRLTAQPFFQPIYDLESAQIACGRIAILGDAAFVARPHCGMGVTKAAEDALALMDALARHGNDVDAALQTYAGGRQMFGRWIVELARRLGSGIGAAATPSRLAGYLRTPAGVMREVAVPLEPPAAYPGEVAVLTPALGFR